MNYLFFNMSEYAEWERDGVPNRNRHVFFGIAHNPHNTVVAVDFMPFTIKRALKIWFRNILRKNKGEVVYSSLFDSCIKVSKNVYVFTSIRSTWNEYSFYKALKRALKKIDFSPDVLWSYFPYFTGYFDEFEAKKVFDAVDDWSKHENFKTKKRYLAKQYANISEKADTIFTVSKKQDAMFPAHQNVHWVPNGVDVKHFSSQKKCESTVLNAIRDLPQPIVGYVGIIQKRIDFKLVAQAAEKYPDYQFVFFGPVWPDAEISHVEHLKNVHFLGKVRYKALPSVIHCFDVGIIPHKVNAFTSSMNPLKLYEYLAAGKSVVTTPVSGIDAFEDIVLVGSEEVFVEGIEKAVHLKNKKAQEYIHAAEKHSWKTRINTMLEYIKEI